MKLFVDDIRACPDGWQLARTIDRAIRILDTQEVKEVSLDYDIRCCCIHCKIGTYEPVARFIRAKLIGVSIDDFIKVRIHTSNFDGGKRMAKIIGIEYQPYIYNEDDYK